METVSGAAILASSLHGCIVDLFWDDKFTLGTCGLVCKEWLSTSRKHLFRSIVLCPKTTPRFVTLLDSPACTVSPYVRNLRLRAGRGQFLHEKVLVQKVITPLQHLSAIVCLTIEDLKWSTLSLTSRSALIGSFTRLNRLCLSHSTFETLDQVIDMICARPELEELQLDDVSWNSTSIEPLADIPLIDLSLIDTPCPSRLQTLHLGCCPKEDIIHWLLHRQGICMAIQSLALDVVTPKEIASVAELLRAVGPSLRCLDLCMSRLDQCEDDFIHQVDLGSCTQLRSIKFSGLVLILWRPLPWIPLVLSQIKSPCLQEIHFTLSMMDPDNLDLVDWSAIGHLALTPVFDSLDSIRFTIYGGVDLSNIQTLIKSKLKHCDDRGILRFDDV